MGTWPRLVFPVLVSLAAAACTSPASSASHTAASPTPSVSLGAASPAVASPVPELPATPSPSATKPVISKAGLSYFFTVALGAEYGSTARFVARWTKPVVTVRLHGKVDTRSRGCLNKVVADFNALTATTDLRLTTDPADIEVHIAPVSRFRSLVKSYVRGNDGYVSTRWSTAGTIVRATVLIRSSGISDRTRCHLIREELTQGMGLLRDSGRYWNSIFQIDYDAKPVTYSKIDKEVIRLLYSGALQPGDDRKDVRAAVVTK